MENGLTQKEKNLEQQIRKQYLYYQAQFVASIISSIYNIFGNDYDITLNMVIELGRDDIVLNQNEEVIFYQSISQNLCDLYHYVLVSKEKEKLEIKEM